MLQLGPAPDSQTVTVRTPAEASRIFATQRAAIDKANEVISHLRAASARLKERAKESTEAPVFATLEGMAGGATLAYLHRHVGSEWHGVPVDLALMVVGAGAAAVLIGSGDAETACHVLYGTAGVAGAVGYQRTTNYLAADDVKKN